MGIITLIDYQKNRRIKKNIFKIKNYKKEFNLSKTKLAYVPGLSGLLIFRFNNLNKKLEDRAFEQLIEEYVFNYIVNNTTTYFFSQIKL